MPTVVTSDDSAVVQHMFRNYLKDTEFEIIGKATNGREAVELYKQHRPDIITIDLTMPEMSGIEAIKEICQFDPDACCIVCSALEKNPTTVEAIKNGAKDYLSKPFDKEVLVKKLRNLIKRVENE